MKKTMNVLLMSLGVMAQSQLMADGCCPDERCYIPAGAPLDPCCGATPGLPFPAALDLECGWDVYAMGEWVYWKIATMGNALSFLCMDNSLNGSQSFGIMNNFNYASGFRVALGYEMKDVATFEAKYTWYHTKHKDSFTAPDNFLLKAYNTAGLTAPSFSSVSKDLNFKLDILDFYAKKGVYIGTRTQFEAGMGLKAVWSTQNYDNTFIGLAGGSPTNPSGTVKNYRKFWAVGPTGEINAKYMLPWGFRIIGGVELNVGWGNASDSYLSLSFPGASAASFNGLNYTNKTNGNHFFELVDTQIGLEWETYFWCDQYHFSLFSTFETQRWNLTGIANDTEFARTPQIYGFNVGGQLEF